MVGGARKFHGVFKFVILLNVYCTLTAKVSKYVDNG